MAQWTGKVVGGLLGALAAGPVGAALGVLLGHQFDTSGVGPQAAGPALDYASVGEIFFRTTFQVMGHIAKAHGRVSEEDIEAARAVMAELRLDPAQVHTAIAHFTAGKQPGFALDAALAQLVRACGGRGDVLRVFFEIQVRFALAARDLDATSRALLQRIGSRLGISFLEIAQIEAVLRIRRGAWGRASARPSASIRLEEAYRVLGIEPNAGDEEVAKAYRRQLSRHHPDKLKANGLPESMIEHAKQRTQQIIEAYELIRERRA
jgi:DnaJ like chaperone protein